MNKDKIKEFKSSILGRVCESSCVDGANRIEIKEPAKTDRYFEILATVALVAFGLYHSVLYFGHQVVPYFDFPGFAKLGHNILSFEMPSSFKIAPVVGVLQVLLGYVVGGKSPDFVGGWVLNSLLHPLSAVLLWLVGRRIIGKSALWIAVIAIINPWVLQLLTEAIAETTFLFCVLATFYFIFRRSNWGYVFASITTMVRYEGAALIMAAFVMDMIYRKSRGERVQAFIYSVLASIPLAMWMLGTILNWQQESSTHYLKELGAASGGKFVLVEHLKLVWMVGLYPLSTLFMRNDLSRVLAAGGFTFGVVYGLYKRQWNILALLIFFVPYFLLHVRYPYLLQRYHSTIFWIPLLICFYGLQSIWKLINKNNRVPMLIMIILQAMVLEVAVLWLVKLLPSLPEIAPMSRRSISLPYVAIGIVCLIFLARILIYRAKYLWRDIVISALTALIIVSNQFVLVQVVGNGKRDIEFKYLLDWYVANAEPGAKLVLTASGILQAMAPEHEDCFIHTGEIGGDNPAEFLRRCYQQDITYVAWDSRIGFRPEDRYYKFFGVKNISMLAEPRSIGSYEFITQIRSRKNRLINVFRLLKPN